MSEAYWDFLFLAAIAVGFAIRAYPLVHFRLKSIDNYYHLLAARQIWREKRLPDRLNGFLFAGTYSYPPLLHLLLSPLAGKFNTRMESIAFLVAPAMDVLSAAVIYLVTGLVLDKSVAFFSAILYLVTPLLVIESLPISPRTLGAFFLNLFMLLIFLYAHDHNYWLLLPASLVCIPFILLAHKMASQSLLFVSIASFIVFAFFDPLIPIFGIISLMAGVSFTLAVSKGFYKKVFRGHRAMLVYHFRHGSYKGEKRFGNPIHIIQRWPSIILLLPIAFIGSLSQELLINNLVPLIWGIVFVALAVLWRYGDNYRYLVYAIAPLSIVFASIALTISDYWLAVILALSIAASGLRLGLFFRKLLKKESAVTSDLLDCLMYANRQEKYGSIGCIPVSLNYPCAFYSEKAVLGAEAAPEPWEKGDDLSTFYKDEKLLLDLMSKYNTNLFLVNRADPNGLAFESLIENSTQLVSNVVHSSGHYGLYELDKRSS